jgi:hypothetical protein
VIGKTALETSAIAQQMGAHAPVFAVAAPPAEATSGPPMRRPSACGLREFHFGAPQTQGLGLARPLLIRWRAAGAGRRPDDGTRRHVQF